MKHTSEQIAETGKKVIGDFKKFAFKGNVIDMAVGVVIGTAFTKIVNSLVNDIIMPALGIFLGKVNFTELKYAVKTASDGTEVAIKYGNFMQMVLDFLIIAVSVYVFVKILSKGKEAATRKEKEAAEAKAKLEAEIAAEKKRLEEEAEKAKPKPVTAEQLLVEIRDLLKKQ